jgi:hypothetical protein
VLCESSPKNSHPRGVGEFRKRTQRKKEGEMHHVQKTTLQARRLRSCWLTSAVAATLAIGITIVTAATSAFAKDKEQEAAELGPGCAPDRPAIAHHAGGTVVNEAQGQAPIPCYTAIGFPTTEVSVVVTNEGTVLFQPAIASAGLPIGAVRSMDKGATWEFVDPDGNPPRSGSSGSIDMNLSVDHDTGRVFWSNDLEIPVGYLHIQRVDHSDDDGKTWVPSAGLPMHYDHTQIFSGPPTSGLKHLMQGYPNVVYVVVSGGFTCPAYGFCGTHITRSLDGGKTFGPAVELPYPPECPAPGANPVGGYGLKGIVGRDGTVYLPFTPCVRPYVAISSDEGSTWQLSLVADTQTIGWGELGLGMDKQGNLYAAWTGAADRLPYLAISRDSGLRWSTPLMIAAPDVKEAFEPELVAGARGQVAVTYYGSKNPPVPFPSESDCTSSVFFFLPGYGFVSQTCPGYEHETWNTYVTETFDALAEQPLFWSATLNDPARPTFFGETPTAMRLLSQGPFTWGNLVNTVGARGFDYFGMTMAPDYTPWVGFFQACPFGHPIPGNPVCDQAAGGPNDGIWGLVGRLVRIRSDADNTGH